MSFRYSPMRKSMRERTVGQSDIPLVVCIQNTLERYPDGSILKELLQNAEDAEATEIKLTIDCRTFGTERMFEPQGPVKEGEDLSVCQGPALVVWNDAMFTKSDWNNIQHPERSYKADDSEKIGRFGSGFIAVYHLTDFPWILSGHRLMVLDPRKTGIFGTDSRENKRGYDWILNDPEELDEIRSCSDQFAPFDLPANGSSVPGTTFRLPLRKKKSQLSPVVYSALKTDANHNKLGKDSEFHRSLDELFKSFIDDGPNLLLFLSSVRKLSLWKRLPYSRLPELIYEVSAVRDGPFTRIDITTPRSRSNFGWIVERFESESAEITYMGNVLRTSPRVALAAQFPEISEDSGFTFCFLPLPQDEDNSTGFPAHVHGCFALSDNRRNLLWPSTDNQNDSRTKWNQVLISKVLPVAYVNMLKTVKKFVDDLEPENFDKAVERLGKLWPHPARLKRQWKPFLSQFYRLAHNEELFWSDFSQRWVSFNNAVFPQKPYDIENNLAVQEICRIKKLDIVNGVDPLVPTFFTPFMPETRVKYMTPQLLASILRDSPELLNGPSSLSTVHKLDILKFLILDSNCAQELSGLRLLPLADGTFTEFISGNYHSSDSIVFVSSKDNPLELYPGIEGRFLLPEAAISLESVISLGNFQLKRVSSDDFPVLLRRVLSNHSVGSEYFDRVWAHLRQNFASLSPLHNLSILPEYSDESEYLELNPNHRYISARGIPHENLSWLQNSLNLTFIAWEPYLNHPDLDRYVLDSDKPESLIKALKDVWKNLGKRPGTLKFDPSDEKFLWFVDRLSKISPEQLDDDETQCLRKLPIFPSLHRSGKLISAEQGRSKCLPRDAGPDIINLLVEVGYPHPIVVLDYHNLPLVSLANVAGVLQWPYHDVVAHLIHMANQDWNSHRKIIIHWLLLNQQKYNLDLSTLNAAYIGSELIELAQFSDAHPIAGQDILLVEAMSKYLGETLTGRAWSILRQRPVVLCSRNRLHQMNTVVMRSPTSICPFLCNPAPGIHEQFLVKLGVKSEADLDDKIKLLLRVAEYYKSEPLREEDLEAVMRIARLIYDEIGGSLGFQPILYLPDSKKVMRHTDTLVYGTGDEDVDIGDNHFTHPQIFRDMARAFGIPVERDFLLQKFEVAVSAQDQLGEEFGQEVDLVSRIHRLLEEYHGPNDFLQEFVQNADDAGASKVSFIIDRRSHGTSSLLSDDWEALQGPAVLVYNNSIFHEGDFVGIQKLGVGSKMEDRGKIGRFGAGFNCAYRYSDCPTFISNNKDMCVLDPLRAFIAHAANQKSGKRFRVDSMFRHKYNDCLSSFTIPVCGNESFRLEQSTMFRLPLRTSGSAIWSELFEPSQLSESISSAGMDALRMLLFLKCIEEISSFEISETGEIQQLWQVNRSSRRDQEMNGSISSKRFGEKITHYSRSKTHEVPATSIEPVKSSFELDLIMNWESRKQTISETWVVALRLGFDMTNAEKQELTTDFTGIKVLPVAGVAKLLESGSNNVKRYNSATKTPDLLFVSLPLPHNTGLPVTLHGHFCLDSEGRKNFFTAHKDEKSDQGLWNQLLASKTLLPAYMDLIFVAKEFYTACPADFWKYFPDPEKTANRMWKEFAQSVYLETCRKSLPFLPCFAADDREILFERHQPDISSIYGPFLLSEIMPHQVKRVLITMGMKVVHCDTESAFVVSNMVQLGGVPELDRSSLASFLKAPELQANLFPLLPVPLVDSIYCQGIGGLRRAEKDGLLAITKILEYMYENQSEISDSDFDDLPLLVTKDGLLRKFSNESAVFLVRNYVAGLFPSSQSTFAHVAYCGSGFSNHLFKNLTIEVVNDLLHFNVPAKMHESAGSEWCSADTLESWWLKRFWQEIFALLPEDKTDDAPLEKLNHWKLLPIKPQGLPVQLCLLKEAPFILSPSVSRWIAGPEGLPSLDLTFFNENNYRSTGDWKILEPLLANSPEEVLTALNIWNSRGRLSWGTYSSEGRSAAGKILAYFSVQKYEYSEEERRKIRALPIFETVYGDLKALGETETFVASLHSELPQSLSGDGWDNDSILLRYNQSLSQLYSTIEIKPISEETFLSRFLIPSMENMDYASQKDHMNFFRQNQDRLPESTVEALCQAKLICINGQKKSIRDFSDHTLDILSMSQPEEAFLPQDFMEHYQYDRPREWMEFFRGLGLKTNPSMSELLQLAERVAKTEDIEEADPLSKVIVQSMERLATDGCEEYMNLLGKMVKIPFIPSGEPEPELSEILEGTRRRMISIHGSPRHEDRYLIWTSRAFLPEWVEYSGNLLRLTSESRKISCSDVIEHSSAILLMLFDRKILLSTEEAVNSSESLVTQKQVMEKIYRFFQNNLKECRKELITNFGPNSSTPFVLVEDGKRIVSAQMVVERMPELGVRGISEIAPFLYELPPGYKERYYTLFRKLGMEERPSNRHFVRVLAQMKQFFGFELSPHSLTSVQLAQYGLVVQEQRDWEDIKQLYLLGTDGRLHLSTELTYKDESKITARLQKSRGITRKQLFWDCPEVPEETLHDFVDSLPLRLRPTLVSELVVDQVDDAKSHLCRQGEICPLKTNLRDLIHSKELLSCLKRLYYSEKGLIGSIQDWKEAKRFLKSVRVVCFDYLKTILAFQGSRIPEVGTEQEMFSYFDKQRSSFAFVHSADADPQNRLTCMLDLALSLAPHLPIKDCKKSGVLFPVLLSFDTPDKMGPFLEKQGILPLPEDIKRVSMRLGTPLTAKYVDLLIHSPHHFFSTGEIVGLCTENISMDVKYPEGKLVIILAQVIRCYNKYDPPMHRRYEILVSPSGQRVQATGPDLYKFTEPIIEPTGALVLRRSTEGGENGHDSEQSSSTSGPEGKDLKRELIINCHEVTKLIEEAFKLDEKGRKKALRRLMLAWHPDKNPNRLEMADAVFKHIQQEIQRLEKVHDKPEAAKFDPEQWKAYWEQFKREWGDFEKRTRNESRDEEEADEDGEGGSSSGNSRTTEDHHSRSCDKVELGKKYMQQARKDLSAAEEMYHSFVCGHEHIVYLVQQSVEKILKAAILSKNESVDRWHELLPLSLSISRYDECPERLEELVSDFVEACNPSMTMLRYPDDRSGAAPFETYTETQRSKAINMGQDIFFRIQKAFEPLQD